MKSVVRPGDAGRAKEHSLLNLANMLNQKELQTKTTTFFEIKHYALQFKVMEKEEEAYSSSLQQQTQIEQVWAQLTEKGETLEVMSKRYQVLKLNNETLQSQL